MRSESDFNEGALDEVMVSAIRKPMTVMRADLCVRSL